MAIAAIAEAIVMRISAMQMPSLHRSVCMFVWVCLFFVLVVAVVFWEGYTTYYISAMAILNEFLAGD